MSERSRSSEAVALAVLSLALFLLALLDQASGFAFLDSRLNLLLVVLSAGGALLALARRRASARARGPAAALFLAALLATAIRQLGYEPIRLRTAEEWHEHHDAEARRMASTVQSRFREICALAEGSAESLAQNPMLRQTAESRDPERISASFAILAAEPLAVAHPSGTPGATLFDSSLRPLAWAHENRSLDRFLASRHGVPGSGTEVLSQGAETFLLAFRPLPGEAGLVSVEVPLAADRRLENRYLQDFDALSSWVGRSLRSRFFSREAEADAFARALDQSGDPYWAEEAGARRLSFGLRCRDDRLLGVASLAAEPPDAARLESRRVFELASSIALVLGAAVAVGGFLATRPPVLLAICAIWGLRLTLHATNVPLGFGLDLDNPADYASSLVFGLASSPADLLVTALAFLASTVLLLRSIRTGAHPPRAVPAGRLLAPVAVLSVLLAVQRMVLDAWLNSSLALSEVSFASENLPRLTVQLGLVALFVGISLLAALLFSSTSLPSSFGGYAWLAYDVLVVVAVYLALSPRGHGDSAALAAIPFFALRIAALPAAGLSGLFDPRGFMRRLPATALFLFLPALLFYPSLAYYEAVTVRGFIEGTVAPAVLRQDGLRASALLETARDIDRMIEEGRIEDFAQEDLAFRIWAATDLAVSSLSSAIEVVDPERRVVSRFATSFPTVELNREARHAPLEEWMPEPGRHPGDPAHPGFDTARRSFRGPNGGRWEIRVRVAADWRNLPFISTTDPYLQLFRTAAVEVPERFPHQELELVVLTHDGRPIFESVGEALEPGEALLERALLSPLWWEHEHENATHRTYLVGDEDFVYALSHPEKPPRAYAAEAVRWLLLAGILGALALVAVQLLGASGLAAGLAPREVLSGIGSSFSAKLYVAFVLLALVPIASLSFLIRGLVIRDLERDLELEATERARVAARLLQEIQLSTPSSDLGTAPVTDAVLERVRNLVGVDVDLYVAGELLATSKPELVSSGLLRTRAAPAAHRDIVVERRSHSVHRESAGSFQYLVVSVPMLLSPWSEPGILSLPLASRQAEIEARVESLNQTVLLAALGFSLAAALLAYTLARRIAGPINELTDATRSVAQGSLDVSLETSAEDEIGTLFESFNQMTADLKRQREDLEKSKKFEAWAEMARQVAHEVKNPLTPIQLSTEHLLRVYGDPGVDFRKVLQQCAETILQQVRTLRQISMEFSTFASPGPLKLEPTDLARLVRETLEPYRKTPPAGVAIEVSTPLAVPPILTDSRLVRRTLVNLLENALHAVNGQGRIEVGVSELSSNGARFVEVVVSDNGVGIDPEVKDRVFEPYFSTRAAGTGLGLAIAKKVVTDHGGTIALESERGRGTEVRIRLPVADRAP